MALLAMASAMAGSHRGFATPKKRDKMDKPPRREDGSLHVAEAPRRLPNAGLEEHGEETSGYEKECRALERDGACVIRGLLLREAELAAKEAEWARLTGQGVVVGDPDGNQQLEGGSRNGRFLQVAQLAATGRRKKLVEIVRGSGESSSKPHGIAGVAALALQTPQVAFSADDFFIKEPMAMERTPWHRDLTAPYIEPKQQKGRHVNIWIALDPIHQSCSLRTIQGSHRWAAGSLGNEDQELYFDSFLGNNWRTQCLRLAAELGIQDTGEAETFAVTFALEQVELAETDAAHFERVMGVQSWELQPGDCVIMHRQCIHGSKGNDAYTARRAYSTRWSTDRQVPRKPRYEGRAV